MEESMWCFGVCVYLVFQKHAIFARPRARNTDTDVLFFVLEGLCLYVRSGMCKQAVSKIVLGKTDRETVLGYTNTSAFSRHPPLRIGCS